MDAREMVIKGIECCLAGVMKECQECPFSFVNGGTWECQTTLGDHILALIQQLESQVTKWVDVNERLPRNEVSVIVYCAEDGHSWYAFRRGGLWWRPGERVSVKIYGTVTHWMPLPQPPKEV